MDYVSDDDLLDSASFQADRNDIRARLRKEARNAVTTNLGSQTGKDLVDFAAISAKSDMAGALLVTTVEMLADKVTASNFQGTLEKLCDTIANAEALLRLSDSNLTIQTEFKKLLRLRLTSQWKYCRSQEAARENQRATKELERDERNARQEAANAQEEAEKEESITMRAIARTEERLREASIQEKEKFESQLVKLQAELAEAKLKSERAKSRAQQTRQGHVYIISNIGSFGKELFKIGMTRRLDPMDRIWELSDASVPFDFDVHALIETEDAPRLESEMHQAFASRRANKINLRKEFFRVSIEEIQAHLTKSGQSPTIRILPSADEYYAGLTNVEGASESAT